MTDQELSNRINHTKPVLTKKIPPKKHKYRGDGEKEIHLNFIFIMGGQAILALSCLSGISPK